MTDGMTADLRSGIGAQGAWLYRTLRPVRAGHGDPPPYWADGDGTVALGGVLRRLVCRHGGDDAAGAAPAVLRRVRAGDRARAVPPFLAGYLAVWALVGLPVYAAYRP